MEVIGFILAAVVTVGIVVFIRSRVRARTGSGRASSNPNRPDKA